MNNGKKIVDCRELTDAEVDSVGGGFNVLRQLTQAVVAAVRAVEDQHLLATDKPPLVH